MLKCFSKHTFMLSPVKVTSTDWNFILIFYITWTVGCVGTALPVNTWHKQHDALGNALLETLSAAIQVDVTLTKPTYLRFLTINILTWKLYFQSMMGWAGLHSLLTKLSASMLVSETTAHLQWSSGSYSINRILSWWSWWYWLVRG